MAGPFSRCLSSDSSNSSNRSFLTFCSLKTLEPTTATTAATATSTSMAWANLNTPVLQVHLPFCKANNDNNTDLFTSLISDIKSYSGNDPFSHGFAGQLIGVIYGTVADDLPPAIEINIIPYVLDVKISYITAGDEIKPSDPLAQYVGPAIQNLNNAITGSNLQIKVSTAIDMSLFGIITLHLQAHLVIVQTIVSILVNANAPLFANVYPYFAYIGVVVQDGNLGYQNLFDAIVDVLYSALEKIGGAKLTTIVMESGWPSDGNDGVATVDNAGTYYKNLISHVKNGTPKRPGPLETYLFALFDEDQKGPAETEKHYGLFSPTKQPKCQLIVQSIGVNYGTIADDLPPATEVIALLKTRSDISVIVGVVNNDLQGLATSPSAANGWVQTNISPYLPDVNISYIAAGNEIKPSDPLAQYIGPAMQNLYNAVTSSNFPTQIKLDYALLNSSGVVVQDGNLGYQNLFYAMMDSLYYTLEKIGEANLTVIVTETGCPSDGGVATTIDNAGTYYKNLISHVNNGTPKRPGPFETYLFALWMLLGAKGFGDKNQSDGGERPSDTAEDNYQGQHFESIPDMELDTDGGIAKGQH
ncbi:glucan endo-1 [Quercus suber]|uniref:glucan endo-1,3-beta-D-glucosidase n=1 Tax=Quercus suber TaxID=58331 RepID=A0AAW0INH1_QUESU